jgi:hypothetical protein
MAFDISTQLVVFWVEGLFSNFQTLALESDCKSPQVIFFAKIDDHAIHRGNRRQILAWWRHSVASSLALDLLYQAINSAFHQRITKDINTASKRGAFFWKRRFCHHP